MESKFTKEDRDVLQMCIPRNMGVFLAEAAQHLLDDYDTARASEAMLRGTLADINAYLNDPETTIAQGDQIENVLNAIDTALSGSSGERLERHDADKDRTIAYLCDQNREHLSQLIAVTTERDTLLGKPESVHQGALAAIEAMKQMQGNAEKIQALQNEAATAGIRLAMVEAERDGLAAALAMAERTINDAMASASVNNLSAAGGRLAGYQMCGRDYPAILAARDARIKAEARRKALMEAAKRADADERGCLFGNELRELAQEADHEAL